MCLEASDELLNQKTSLGGRNGASFIGGINIDLDTYQLALIPTPILHVKSSRPIKIRLLACPYHTAHTSRMSMTRGLL